MAKVDVKCPLREQTGPIKNTAMAKVVIGITVVNLQTHLPARCTYQCRRTHLKKLLPRNVTTLPLDNLQIQLICEVDEMWSFVYRK